MIWWFSLKFKIFFKKQFVFFVNSFNSLSILIIFYLLFFLIYFFNFFKQPDESIELNVNQVKDKNGSTFTYFESPNFRKLYATLSVNSMMGSSFPNESIVTYDFEEKTKLKHLPADWEKHEDDSGPYYWHVPRYLFNWV